MDKVKFVRKSRSGSTKQVQIIYFDDNTSVNARSSYVLLRNHLLLQDEDYISRIEIKKEKIQFSRDYLNQYKLVHGDIVCSYCNNRHLVIEEEGMRVNQNIIATIDHIIPLSKGGDFKDPKNIRVSCGKCNSKKGSLPLNTFLELLPNQKVKQKKNLQLRK